MKLTGRVLCIGHVLRMLICEKVKYMNLNYIELKFPKIKTHPWHKVRLQCVVVCLRAS